jgi:hypothetical protein
MLKNTLSTVSLTAVMLLAAVSQAATPPNGTYQQSCNPISSDGRVLTASCRTYSGSWMTTQLEFTTCVAGGDISNNNGHLVCVGGTPVGSYQRSCPSRSFNGYYITASCRTIAGTLNPTRIDVPNCTGDIANINGVLTCGSRTCAYDFQWTCWYANMYGAYGYYTAIQQCGNNASDAANQFKAAQGLSNYGVCGIDNTPCCDPYIDY